MEGYLAETGFEQPGHHAHWSWRLHDTEQRVLLQALALWERYSEDAHLAMEGHAEQLRALGSLAALVAGFDMVAFAQFDFDVTAIPVTVLLGFGITNALTVALCVLCMTLCMLVQSSIYRAYASLVSEHQQALFVFQCREFALRYRLGDRPPLPSRNFQNHWDYHCRSAWHQAIYMFTAGVVCFLCNIAFASFIKFDGYLVPAICMSALLGLALLYYLVNSTRWLLYITRAGNSQHMHHQEVDAVVKPSGLPFDWCLPHGPHAHPHNQLTSGPSLPASAWTHLVGQGLGRSQEGKWRAEDMQQVALMNARALWARFVERQNDAVEERTEQLRGFSFLSGIVAGFIVSSFLQVNFDPLLTAHWLQLAFALTVGVTAAVTTCSMATCSMVLLSVLKTAGSLVSEREEAAFMADCHRFATSFQLGDRPPAPRRTFRMHWELRCQHLWYRAFYMFSFGLLSFLINLMFAAWIKFKPTLVAPSATTGILGAALVYLILVHSRWAKHIFHQRLQAPVQLPSPEPAGLPFDWYLPPARTQGTIFTEE